ncbi:glycosyltransferase family 2 protein [Mucilaginibacter sp. PAMB04168]|uniref:glycosyltransferase family 2 protein n=1 Tax=Mucilaginibacter sp. PAMB04168 TaxID=3138567 RepID=UPI0031F6CC85
MTKIAVLLTTFNRKDKTITCLQSLKVQKLPADVHIDIYLTDDASADDTVDAVKGIFPDSYILHGTGQLFWAGGMRNSWNEARKGNYDYYLLLNDDTTLIDNAVANLLACSKEVLAQKQTHCVCIGSTQDVFTGGISYGGKKLTSKYYLKSALVYDNDDYQKCDLGNANIMLVPDAIVKSVGILSDHYTHGIADYDYTLKVKKAGFEVIVAPAVLGYCTDDHGKSWKSQTSRLSDRIKYLKSPKGLAYKEYLLFIKTHFPLYYPFAFTKLWMKTLLPVLWQVFKK